MMFFQIMDEIPDFTELRQHGPFSGNNLVNI